MLIGPARPYVLRLFDIVGSKSGQKEEGVNIRIGCCASCTAIWRRREIERGGGGEEGDWERERETERGCEGEGGRKIDGETKRKDKEGE